MGYNVLPAQYYANNSFFQQIVQLLYNVDKVQSNIFPVIVLTTQRSIHCYNNRRQIDLKKKNKLKLKAVIEKDKL